MGNADEVPSADGTRVPAASRRCRRRACGAPRATHARRDGRGRDPRPARWRVQPLRDRADLARAALREDAPRQRPARARLPACVAADPRRGLPGRRSLDARLRGARDDASRRRLRGQPGRRHGGRGGRDLRVDGAPRSRGAGGGGPRRGCGAVRGGVRCDPRRQLGRAHDPPARRHGLVARDADRAGDRLLAVLVDEGGRLRRSWKDGQARHAGTLEDHACLADGLLALYEATANERWFTAAQALADTILAHFGDPAGGFFDTADDAERLVARPRSLEDNALPSGNAMAALVLQRLDALTGERRYADAAEGALGLVGSAPARYPTAFAQWLIALDWRTGPVDEIALVGPPEDPRVGRLLDVARAGYRPRQVIAVAPDPGASVVPLLQARFAIRGMPTAFVCRGFACRQPVTEPEALAALLVG